jgi:protein TIF31
MHIGVQVGIEVAPRDYGLDTPTPFKKMDIISMVPVHKVHVKTTTTT